MAIMAGGEPITLKEVQLRLGVPQHVLIHLCEKGVVEPDFAETSGRGKRREFSQRNLFEFAVALALRKFDLPVATAAFVVRLLRSLARATQKTLPGFELPTSLIDTDLQLTLHVFDGRTLVFSARGDGLRKPLVLAVNIDGFPAKPPGRPRIERLDNLPREFEVMLQLDLTRIARNASNQLEK